MTDSAVAVLVALGFTLLLVLVHIPRESKPTYRRACFSYSAVFYFAILGSGNTATTLLAASIKNDSFLQKRRALEYAKELETMDEQDLNAHVSSLLGAGHVAKLDAVAQADGANAVKLKALALARGDPEQAAAIASELRARKEQV